MQRFAWVDSVILTAGLAVALPAAAVSFSFDAFFTNQSVRADLGGGLIHGSECSKAVGSSDGTTLSDGPCHAAYDYNGASSGPRSAGVNLSTTTGSNSVGADAGGGTFLESANSSDVQYYGPGTFLRGRMEARASLRDSQPDQYHTWASSSMTIHDWFDITVPDDQALYFHLAVGSSGSGQLTTQQDVTFTITSLANSQVFYQSSGPSDEELDLSAYAGQQLRFELQAAAAMYGDPGFANGATTFRTFFTSAGGYFAFRQLPIPEPGTLPLLGLGIAGLAAVRRSRT